MRSGKKNDMKKIIELPHRMDDYACMWNGIEDLYMQVQVDSKALEHTGYNHIAFRLGSKQAVDELTLRLREDGYPVVSEPRMTGDGYYESCIAGIEGNLIEITE